ncbi:MAG: hypothetical protein EOP48_17990 [Sphingobacteriales bacterium]|nr:MAG: hypothetical protein EOP48_17990 [Sphingobacteriales bacterium]
MSLKGKRRGLLHIKIVGVNERILVTVNDNGIGRQAASLLSHEKKHISVGMLLTEERLKTLQDIFPDQTFSITIQDLEQGTSVAILLSNTYDEHEVNFKDL